jgi:hypothetical protein
MNVCMQVGIRLYDFVNRFIHSGNFINSKLSENVSGNMSEIASN